MGWFDEQIKQRKLFDDDVFAEAFINIAGAVEGSKISAALKNDRHISKNAIEDILKYYKAKGKEIPEEIQDLDEQLEFLMRPYGIMRRTVKLEKGWYKDAIGPMIGTLCEGNRVVSLIPSGINGYVFTDLESGKKIRVNRKNENLFDQEAIGFYKPFPLKKMNMGDFIKYIFQSLSTSDFVMFGVASLAVTLIGLFMPVLNSIIFSDIITGDNTQLWTAMLILLVCISISSLMFDSVRRLLMARINIKMSLSVESATMSRILSLPVDFFKKYSSGELFKRSQQTKLLCDMIANSLLSVALTAVFSLIFIVQIFIYAKSLALAATILILASMLICILTICLQSKVEMKLMELTAKKSGMSYAMITGVQKIKLSGAEKRAFARWGNLYAKEAEIAYNPPLIVKISPVFNIAITLIGSIIIYYLAIRNSVSVADYYAFNTAYGMVAGAFTALAGITLNIAQIKPILSMIKPILQEKPEVSEGKQVITRLSGGIELNNVTFRYNEKMPAVVDDISLKIRSGQYVAIVGATGCGKSTLMRLMLGFETPQTGAIYYDGRDLETIDLKSLRRRIGVVMQSGKLFQGDIFSNITISAPYLTMKDAWEAAQLAGIAEDIKRMPMGMNTVVSEGSGGVSGGQRQRLMIARAIVAKPKVLMFDEATSALDNLTQKNVSEALEALKCTRIVIAHRLSTIKNCDRIVVLNKGKIIEDGTYEELIANGGYFAELVSRQRLDDIEYVGKTTVY